MSSLERQSRSGFLFALRKAAMRCFALSRMMDSSDFVLTRLLYQVAPPVKSNATSIKNAGFCVHLRSSVV
jgi:hypothetical protein